jgi:hypothetical protein
MAIIKLDLFQINANNSQTGQVLTSNGTGVAWSNTALVYPDYISVGNNSVNTQIWAGNVYLNGSTLRIGNTADALIFTEGGITVGNISIVSDAIFISNTTVDNIVALSANGINVGSVGIYTSGLDVGNIYITDSYINVGSISINTTSLSSGQTYVTDGKIDVGTVSINTIAISFGNSYISADQIIIGNTEIREQSINVGSVGISNNSITIGSTYISGSTIEVGDTTINSTSIQIGNRVAVLSDNQDSANNAYNLGGVSAEEYVNIGNNYIITGVLTFESNVVITGNSTIIANNVSGSAGQILTSNGDSIFWGYPRLDALNDVFEGDLSNNPPSNGHILTYVAQNDKYYVLPLDLTNQALDGGNF